MSETAVRAISNRRAAPTPHRRRSLPLGAIRRPAAVLAAILVATAPVSATAFGALGDLPGATRSGERAGPIEAVAASPVRIEQRLGSPLPLDLRFVDADGRTLRLGEYFEDRRAVVLVPGYFACPDLCGTLMQGLLAALAESGVPASAYRIVAFSIDASETPQNARDRRDVWRRFERQLAPNAADDGLPRIDVPTSPGGAGAQLARAVGFDVRAQPQDAPARFVHAAGFAVATAEGRLSRYFPGIAHAPRDVRLALVEAGEGRIGTLTDRLALACSHYDATTGRYDTAVLGAARVVGLLTAAALVVTVWRSQRAARR